MKTLRVLFWVFAVGFGFSAAGGAAQHFAVGAYNVQNYLLAESAGRPAKSEAARQRVREMIHELNVDVLALAEMGDTNALLELRDSLAAEGLSYPHWDHVTGFDTNIHHNIAFGAYDAFCRLPLRLPAAGRSTQGHDHNGGW